MTDKDKVWRRLLRNGDEFRETPPDRLPPQGRKAVSPLEPVRPRRRHAAGAWWWYGPVGTVVGLVSGVVVGALLLWLAAIGVRRG